MTCKNSTGKCTDNLMAKGLCSHCYKIQYRKSNLKKLRSQGRALFWKNREACLAKQKKYKYSVRGKFKFMENEARRRGLPCTIDFDTYKELMLRSCFYCEISLPRSSGANLDRIDNKKGYEPDNVLTCCWDCNAMRMHKLTVEETKVTVLAVKEFRRSKVLCNGEEQ